MPIALPALTGTITTNLVATALIGMDTPKLASGVATGLVLWVPQVSVSTTDVGSAGAGIGIPVPWAIPQPLLLGLLSVNIPSAAFVGLFTPSLILGLANGLSLSFLQMLISTTHPTVGSGSGVAKFSSPPAAGPMNAGFASAGLTGDASARLATAIGVSLDSAIASFIVPVAIAGSASPAPSSGVGSGKII
jgi:hypothetical protein